MSVSRRKLRYGSLLGAVRHKQRVVSYIDVYARDALARRRARLRPVDVHRLVTPYVSVRFTEQLLAVLPLAAILYLFQMAVLRVSPAEAGSILAGLIAVMLGLMVFLEGVKHGLMPFSEHIGYLMPDRCRMRTVIGVAFVLGVAATLAEPAIGALQSAAGSVNARVAPYLALLLGDYAFLLVVAVAAGVGAAVALGMVRAYFGWGLKPLVLATVAPCLLLSVYCSLRPELAPLLALAWDCGAITTGPVTVPLVLALGVGISASTGRGDNPLSGFGIVTLASLFPAAAVLLAGIGLVALGPAPSLAAPAVAAGAALPWHQQTPVAELLAAARAILPLVALLWVVQRFVIREHLRRHHVIHYGVALALVGMAVFFIGLMSGLVPLGDQAGANVPAAFTHFQDIPFSPLYPYAVGVSLTLAFAMCLGYGATVAEPALKALGITVEDLTDGAFPRHLLIHAVAFGVGAGTAVGVAKLIFGLPMIALLLGGYAVAIVLTLFSTEEFVNLAWDSAGVTTGPVTVPLVLALGVGLGQAVGAVEGFGILAMASVGPIISVLALGLIVTRRAERERQDRKMTTYE